MLSTILAALLLAPGFVVPDPACVLREHVIFADGASTSEFGAAVAISGDTLLVGARTTDRGATDSGAAYVFVKRAGVWTQQAELLPNTPLFVAKFGWSVALEGDLAVVGSLEGAYVYERTADTWSAPTRLIQDDSVRNDFFGSAVDISDGRILVGAYKEDDNGTDSGKAYVYVRDAGGWSVEAELAPQDGAALQEFGAAVALCGERALIGAWGADGTIPGAGAAYTFVRSASGEWLQEQKLVSGVPGIVAMFGWTVDLDGERAIVGNGNNDSPFGDRSAYVYRFDGALWNLEARLRSSAQGFGKTVAIDGDVVLVGAPENNFLGYRTGRTFVYLYRSGALEPAFELPSEEANAQASAGIAIEDGTLVIGLPGAKPPGQMAESGLVEIHALHPVALPSIATRNAGTNPLTYSAAPVSIGEVLHLTVFPAVSGHTHALVVAFDSPGHIVLGGGQTLLCIDQGGNGELVRTGLQPGPIARFDLAVPNDRAYAGLTIYSQAMLVFGATPFALSNAQDIRIGGCLAP